MSSVEREYMGPDPHGFAFRADTLLKSMEADFLRVLAEHQADNGEVPKADGADSGASSPKEVRPIVVDMGGDPDDVRIDLTLRPNEPMVDTLLNHLIRWKLFRDTDDAEALLKFTEWVVREMVSAGVHLEWYSEELPPDPEEM